MAKIIDGKKIAEELLKSVRADAEKLNAEGTKPCLAVIIAGENPASKVYVRNKKLTCERVGIRSLEFALPEETTQAELLALVEKLNNDPSVHGILCQHPLPGHLDERKVFDAISPSKDVDAFHPITVGRVVIGNAALLPCTPAGVMEMLRHEGISVPGKRCVVIGRSNIVGKPMALMLLAADGTVTVCHSKTVNLKELTLQADILVCAAGIRGLVTADMIKPGAAVIDVSINRDGEGKLCGDVDFNAALNVAGAITPVPGGVGPMTIAMLMRNTILSCKLQVTGCNLG
ncbi:MAG: bifunctional methylenetetrahydrofolate dehydrogenase/methenyltetrahydrofolate cyclohydrolase FolD [Oscillospiraceae bacterium]|nr:bifunctional methylenetetrahydrofolate dehydrogenase/methenyltetrahydrofolate cyclohydrolase FolD [Oscillospiraceae bacterium]